MLLRRNRYHMPMKQSPVARPAKTPLASVLAALGLLLAASTALGQPAQEDDAFVLVATSKLAHSNYRQTVILAIPHENGHHVGIMLNRPTRQSLADLFPDHLPSKKVAEPVYFGGPVSQQAVFALIHSAQSPGQGSLAVIKDLFLAITATSVDRIIEERPQDARFYVGTVFWRPGELREELEKSYWHVMDARLDLVFRRDTKGLWEELTRLSRAVRADTRFGDSLALQTADLLPAR